MDFDKIANRATVTGIVANQIQCKLTGQILDEKKAVVITLKRGNESRTFAVTGTCYDSRKADFERNAKATGLAIEVIDGRGLW